MMKVTQHLWFAKDMEAALHFYTSLIPGSSIAWTSAVPADNPMTPAKIKLGKQLFFDPRLSKTGTVSCNSCHDVMGAGVDNLAFPLLPGFGHRCTPASG